MAESNIKKLGRIAAKKLGQIEHVNQRLKERTCGLITYDMLVKAKNTKTNFEFLWFSYTHGSNDYFWAQYVPTERKRRFSTTACYMYTHKTGTKWFVVFDLKTRKFRTIYPAYLPLIDIVQDFFKYHPTAEFEKPMLNDFELKCEYSAKIVQIMRNEAMRTVQKLAA